MRQRVHQPGLSADLDSFDLLDLVQVIQMSRRNLSLVVRAGSQRLGTLRFSQGELLWAEFGTLRGEEAFIALAGQHSGSIEELAWDGHEERNVSQPLSRLVMQAVEYRDNHEQRQPTRAPELDGLSRPLQPAYSSTPFPKTSDFFNGSDATRSVGDAPATASALTPDEDEPPAWVRTLHPTPDGSAAHTQSAAINSSGFAVPSAPLASMPAPSMYVTQTEPMTPVSSGAGPAGFSSLLEEEMAVEIPEPTIPLATPNGKFSLPSLNGNRSALSAPLEEKDDPPTVPLPSMQGSLRNYAPKREAPPASSQREAAPEIKLTPNPLPEPTLTMRAMPEVAAPPQPVFPQPKPLPSDMSPAPSAPVAPSGEPRLSSLAMLEQLAYGGSGNNGHADAGLHEPAAPILPPTPAPAAPGSISHALPGPAASALPTPSVEGTQSLEQALEAFAGQVGNTCVATAVIRSDGKLLAEYKVRHGQDQDLASPAYHMAHVMQSSLRALLMGGWGDLEDTFITGSTHSVMLRRLGRAEKGLFHIAVLERSGNPGLCRVRMRSSEAALLQLLLADVPTRAS